MPSPPRISATAANPSSTIFLTSTGRLIIPGAAFFQCRRENEQRAWTCSSVPQACGILAKVHAANHKCTEVLPALLHREPCRPTDRLAIRADYLDLIFRPRYLAEIVLDGFRVHIPPMGTPVQESNFIDVPNFMVTRSQH